MEKFIPYAKLSKKKQKELAAQKRGSWQGVNPATRCSKNAKAYDRRKARKQQDDYAPDTASGFVFFLAA